LDVASSLIFYLNRRFYLVNQPRDDEMHIGSNKADVVLDEDRVLTKSTASSDLYLIVEEKRVAYWESLLTQRFHIYHQVTACGSYVVLTNRL